MLALLGLPKRSKCIEKCVKFRFRGAPHPTMLGDLTKFFQTT
jgi:hypothetical protein